MKQKSINPNIIILYNLLQVISNLIYKYIYMSSESPIREFFKGFVPLKLATNPGVVSQLNKQFGSILDFEDIAFYKMRDQVSKKINLSTSDITNNFLYCFFISIVLLMLVYPKVKLLSYTKDNKSYPNLKNIIIIALIFSIVFLLYKNNFY